MSIMDPPKFLMTFDLPDLRLPSGKRNVTSVPAQSLTLLNDPFVETLAKHWAAALVTTPHSTPQARLDDMFVAAFGRQSNESERTNWLAFLHDVTESSDLLADEAAWTQLAHAIFNTKEFIYYR
jgi:hypothetical protein